MSDEAVRHGTDNIFADLGYADPQGHLLKAGLVTRIADRIGEERLTQVQAARIMGVSQPDVSRMLRGQFREISVERLMRFLTLLGCEIDIVIRANGVGASRMGTIHLPSAAPAPSSPQA